MSNGRTISVWLTFKIGVHQGSLLGSILFLVFIKDLVNLSSKFQPILYADNTTFLFRDSNAQNFILQCKSRLTVFQNWNISNKLTINVEKKTYCMAVTLYLLECCNQIRLVNKVLEFKNQCKILIMFVEIKLKLNNRSDYIIRKISKSDGVSYRIKDFVPQSILINLYKSLILPDLNHCISIWDGTCDTHTD